MPFKKKLNWEEIILTHKKKCTKCVQIKPVNMFYPHKQSSCGISPACKLCVKQTGKDWRKNFPDKAKDTDLRKKYGITLQEKVALLASQGNVCAACGTDKPGGKYNEWHLDHCHTSKKIRGVLCADCNIILGIAKDDILKLSGLVRYLQGPDPIGLCQHCGYIHDLINKKTVCYRLRHPGEDVDGFPNAWNNYVGAVS